jgi:hypothetical protein
MKQWLSQIFAKRCGSDFSQHPCRAIIHHSLPTAIYMQGDSTLCHQLSICRDIILSHQLSIYRDITLCHPHQLSICRDSTVSKQLSIYRTSPSPTPTNYRSAETVLSPTSYQSTGHHPLPPPPTLSPTPNNYQSAETPTNYQSEG